VSVCGCASYMRVSTACDGVHCMCEGVHCIREGVYVFVRACIMVLNSENGGPKS